MIFHSKNYFDKLFFLILLLLGSSQSVYAAGGLAEPEELRVCADPYMLPFSNREEGGFENRIAELFAKELGVPLKYEWFPQRIGFIRNTLRAERGGGKFKCDLVISVPESFDLADTTEPYYTSTYALVYARGRNLDEVDEPSKLSEAVKRNNSIRIGLTDRGPAQLWVFRNGLMGNIRPYMGQPGDPKVNPGEQMIKEIVAGNIDAAIIWGPTAGYFAKQLNNEVELAVLPLHDDPSKPDIRFEFSMAMAVRYGENEWKKRVDRFIKDNQSKINAILVDYGIPLLPLKKSVARDDDD